MAKDNLDVPAYDDFEFRSEELYKFRRYLKSSISVEDIFPGQLYRCIHLRAQSLPCDSVAYILPTLCAVASLIGTRCRFVVRKGWSEPAVIYGANVSPPSSLKSQIASDVMRPLVAMEALSVKQHRQEVDAASEGEAVISARRFQVQGITHAALTQLLCNPQTVGLLSYQDELSTLFAEMELSHNAPLRAELLKLWNGSEISQDRAGGVQRFAERTALSIFGNVQPDRLAELMAPDKAGISGGDGLWCRFLFFHPQDIPFTYNEIEADLSEDLKPIFDYINSIPSMDFILSEGAKKIGAEAWEQLSVMSRECSAAESAFLGKLRGYSVRIAGLLHIIDCAAMCNPFNSSSEVPAEAMKKSIALCKYFFKQFKQIHAEIGHSSLPKPLTRLIKKVEVEGIRKVTTRDALRWKLCGAKARASEVERFLREVADVWGLGRIEYSERNSTIWVASDG